MKAIIRFSVFTKSLCTFRHRHPHQLIIIDQVLATFRDRQTASQPTWCYTNARLNRKLSFADAPGLDATIPLKPESGPLANQILALGSTRNLGNPFINKQTPLFDFVACSANA